MIPQLTEPPTRGPAHAPGAQGSEEIADLAAKAAAASNDLTRAVGRMSPPEGVMARLASANATIATFAKEAHRKGRSLQFQIDAWYKENGHAAHRPPDQHR